MADRALLISNIFEPTYIVHAWLIGSHDIIHRKNPDFALDAIKQSGFADAVLEILCDIPECSQSILGDVKIEDISADSFALNFLSTNCTHHVNYHDDKVCTVELVAKFTSTINSILCLSDSLIEKLHLEIETPVGNVQV